MKAKTILQFVIAAALAAGLTSCAGKRAHKKTGPADSAKTDPSKKPDSPLIPAVDVEEASLRGSEFTDVPDLGPVYFDYDSFSLKQDALSVVKRNAEYLKTHRDLEVLVAGHCDDRGTVEYNLALGQKRAKELREYYIRLGVPGRSLATISYGEEQPSCSEAAEACWEKNRRAETRIRSRTASNGAPKLDRQ